MHPYEDIIHLPRHVSPKRAAMTMTDRAAQFSPFAALTGYEDVIEETGRLTDRPVELDGDTVAHINAQLQKLLACIRSHPTATVVYFQPDPLKDGGSYQTKTGPVKAVSDTFHTIEFADHTRISFHRITAIHLHAE